MNHMKLILLQLQTDYNNNWIICERYFDMINQLLAKNTVMPLTQEELVIYDQIWNMYDQLWRAQSDLHECIVKISNRIYHLSDFCIMDEGMNSSIFNSETFPVR